jgi:NAD(P)-dependent dehydrogenase (short-subunit alcohol dehydrogenase family)
MDLMLNNKVAVVTGASKGIGMAATQALADEGANVVAGARTTSSLLGLDNVTAVEVDLSKPDGPGRLVQRAIDDHGRVDVLVNNIGAVKLRSDGFLAMTDEDFEWAFLINFFTGLRASRAALTQMTKQGSGVIVNIASVNAFFEPDGGTIDYGAAKAAVLNLSKSLAQEFGSRGIRVTAISPGPVATDLWLGDQGVAATVAEATGVDIDTARDRVVAGIGGFATGRFTSPEEVATLVVLLASERTANVTGANFVIDGGLIKTT